MKKNVIKQKIELIDNRKSFDIALSIIKTMPVVSIDYETTCLEPKELTSDVLTIAVGDTKRAFVFPYNHPSNNFLSKNKSLCDKLFSLLFTKKLVMQNAKFEYRWTKFLGYVIPEKCIVFDTMLAHYIINETSPHGLDFIISSTFPDAPKYKDEMADKLLKKGDFTSVPLEDLVTYNGLDVVYTSKLFIELDKLLLKEGKVLYNYFYDYVMKLIVTIAEMEDTGFMFDSRECDRLTKYYEGRRNNAEVTIINDSKCKSYFKNKVDFNFNSYPQLNDLVYSFLNMPVLKKTKTNKHTGSGGNPSVDLDALMMMKGTGKHTNVIESLILRSKINTMLKSFLYVYPKKVELSIDKKLRTNYNMHVVETGRLSSSNPNLQNIPTDEKLAEYDLLPIKSVFVSRFRNGKILQADYKQIELCTCASYTNDPVFVKAFNEGRDLHGELAEKIFGSGYTKEQRTRAKRTNFSAIFDISAESLAEDLKISVSEAYEILTVFKDLHTPALYDWFDKVWDMARNCGYVENANGRKRHIQGELDSAVFDWQIDKVKRSCWNFPIQSSAVELSLTATKLLYNKLINSGMKSLLIGQVHDSIIMDVHPSEITKVHNMVKITFEVDVLKYFKWLLVPIRVDISVGDNLSNVKTVEKK